MNYFKGLLGRVLAQTFTGVRDRNGRIASLKQLRSRRPQVGTVVFGSADDDTTRSSAIEDATIRGLDVVVAPDGGHLELFAPPVATAKNQ